MKEFSEKEIMNKAERYCIQAERCCSEIFRKLELWGATREQCASIVAHLIQERFIDESRFALAFARDKMRYNQWGRGKIAFALKEKKIESRFCQEALDQLDEEEYADILRKILRTKARSVKAGSDYECRQKLIRFALGRGFEMQEIMDALKEVGRGEEEYE